MYAGEIERYASSDYTGFFSSWPEPWKTIILCLVLGFTVLLFIIAWMALTDTQFIEEQEKKTDGGA